MYHIAMTKIIIDNNLHIDHRTHQTQIKLMIALTAAFKSGKAFKTLTVKQLCLDAHVGRASFYRHHQDIEDLITVESLIALRHLSDDLNDLPNATYATIAGATITTMQQYPLLPALVTWANCRDRVIPLEVGLVQQVLTSLDVQHGHPRFIATYLGHALHQFADQLASQQPSLTHLAAFRLFIQLIPNVLQGPLVPTT